MKEDVKKAEPETVKDSKTSKPQEDGTSGQSEKLLPFLTVVPMAIVKFNRGRGKKKAKSSSNKKSSELEDVKEGPCGIGCLSFPYCERFNNIRYFLFFFYVLVLTQGEPKGWGSLW